MFNQKTSKDVRSFSDKNSGEVSTFVPGQGETCDFENEIGVRIVENTCLSCHKPGSGRMDMTPEARKSWSSHGEERVLVLNRIISGEMPPGGLSEEVRAGAKSCLEKLFPKTEVDECGKETPVLPKSLWMSTSIYFKANLIQTFGATATNFVQNEIDSFSNVPTAAQFSTHTKGGQFQSVGPVGQVASKLAINYYLLQDRFSELHACAPNLNSATQSVRDACANTLLTAMGQKLFRGPIPTPVQTELQAVYANAASAGTAKEGVALGIFYLLQLPEVLYLLGPSIDDPDKTLSQNEILDQMAKFLWASPPDSALIAAAVGKDLKNADARALLAGQMLQDTRAKTQVKNFYSEQLLLNTPPSIPNDATYLNGVSSTNAWSEAVAEFSWFLERTIFEQNGTVEHLFTSNEAKQVGPNIAKIYGITPYQQNAIVNVSGRNGILAKAANLIGAGYEVHFFHRGRMIAKNLLCINIPPPDPNLINSTSGVSIPPDASIRERSTLVTSSGACLNCHNVLNPAASSTLIFDNLGRDRSGGCENVYVTGGSQILKTVCPPNSASKFSFDGGKEVDIANVNQFGEMAGKTLSATQCFVDRYTTYAVGAEFTKANTCFAKNIAKTVFPQKKPMKDILVEVIKSPEFVRRK